MKRYILSAVFLAAIPLVVSAKDGNWHIAIKEGFVSTDKATYFEGKESMSNTVGSGGRRTELEIGGVWRVYRASTPLYSKAFAYTWKHDDAKNDERGYGIGLSGGFTSGNFTYSLGGKVGVGAQKTEGKSFMTQSGTSNVSYIFSGTSQATEALFTKDTDVVEIALLLDLAYALSKNIGVHLGVGYIMDTYSFSYTLANGGSVQLSGVVQDNYQATLGLNFEF